MEPNNIVEWKQTAAGIWTRVPEDEPSPAKGPARQIPSPPANQPPPEPMLQPGKPPVLALLPVVAGG